MTLKTPQCFPQSGRSIIKRGAARAPGTLVWAGGDKGAGAWGRICDVFSVTPNTGEPALKVSSLQKSGHTVHRAGPLGIEKLSTA